MTDQSTLSTFATAVQRRECDPASDPWAKFEAALNRYFEAEEAALRATFVPSDAMLATHKEASHDRG